MTDISGSWPDEPPREVEPRIGRRQFRGRHPFTPGRLDRAIEGLMAGRSYAQIAADLHVNPSTVRRWLALPAAQDRIKAIQQETGERIVRSLVTAGIGIAPTLAEMMRPIDSTGVPVPHRVRVEAARGLGALLGLGSRVDIAALLTGGDADALDEAADTVTAKLELVEARLADTDIIDAEVIE